MAKKLWDYFSGEPFMVNPHLAVVGLNPKKGRKKMAVRRRKVHRRRRAVARTNAPRRRRARRTYRRNPYPVAGMVLNPRKRRRSRMRRNPVRRRRHHSYRRNPAFLGLQLPPLQSVLFAGVGFIAPPAIETFLSNVIPASFQTSTLGRYAVKALAVFGLTFATKQIMGHEQARMVAIGGGAYILHSAINDFAPGMLTNFGMSAYTPGNGGMRGYVSSNQPTFGTLGAPKASFPGSVGSRNLIPNRFSRF